MIADIPRERQVGYSADVFKLLADPTRVKLLWALLQAEFTVNHLAATLGIRPKAASQHLAILRRTGLVHARKEGNYVHYSCDDEQVRALLTVALRDDERTSWQTLF